MRLNQHSSWVAHWANIAWTNSSSYIVECIYEV